MGWKARCLQTGDGSTIFILSAEMNPADVFLVKIKIVSPIRLPPAMLPDAQRVSDKEAPLRSFEPGCGFQQFMGGKLVTRASWEQGTHPGVEYRLVKVGKKWFFPTFPYLQTSSLSGKSSGKKMNGVITSDFGLQKQFSSQTSRQTCSQGHGVGTDKLFSLRLLGPLFPLDLHNSKEEWPVCVQKTYRRVTPESP